jgi:hypothetical protein
MYGRPNMYDLDPIENDRICIRHRATEWIYKDGRIIILRADGNVANKHDYGFQSLFNKAWNEVFTEIYETRRYDNRQPMRA